MATTDDWAAIRGATLDEVAHLLRVEPCRDGDERDGYSMAVLPTGWVIVLGRLGDAELARLSAGGEAVRFTAETTSMTTDLVCYRDGKCRWHLSVLDETDSDPEDRVSIDGEPDRLVINEMIGAVERQRADPDDHAGYVFDAVAEIAEHMTGYSADDASVWQRFARIPDPTVRGLVVDDGAEIAAPPLPDVLDALASFVANPRPTSSVTLAVVVDGKRRTLRAQIEHGALQVVAMGDGARIGTRLDGTAITDDELVWLFSAFYPDGKRLARYAWVPPTYG